MSFPSNTQPSSNNNALVSKFNFVNIFTTSGTFIVPATGTYFIYLAGAGGGGGAGGSQSVNYGGYGGGAGGKGEEIITSIKLQAGDILPITIGAGGAGGAGVLNAAGNNGGDGGSSSIGSLLVARGGGGGGAGLFNIATSYSTVRVPALNGGLSFDGTNGINSGAGGDGAKGGIGYPLAQTGFVGYRKILCTKQMVIGKLDTTQAYADGVGGAGLTPTNYSGGGGGASCASRCNAGLNGGAVTNNIPTAGSTNAAGVATGGGGGSGTHFSTNNAGGNGGAGSPGYCIIAMGEY